MTRPKVHEASGEASGGLWGGPGAEKLRKACIGGSICGEGIKGALTFHRFDHVSAFNASTHVADLALSLDVQQTW